MTVNVEPSVQLRETHLRRSHVVVFRAGGLSGKNYGHRYTQI